MKTISAFLSNFPRRILPVTLSALFAMAASLCANEVVFTEDFETPNGTFFGGKLNHEKHLKLAERQGVNGSTALEATYAGFPRGSERIVEPVDLQVSGTEFTLNYDVRFSENFQFVIGGKLHGLGPKTRVTGGNTMQPTGWSARIMWKEEGAPATYLYVHDKKSPWGIGDTARDFRFEKGRYYAVALHVRLNDPADKNNGYAAIYVDGEQVVESDDLRFRTSDHPDGLIQQFLFSTFHGGNKPKHAPKDADGNFTTVTACFDNFAIRRGRYVRSEPGADWQ